MNLVICMRLHRLTRSTISPKIFAGRNSVECLNEEEKCLFLSSGRFSSVKKCVKNDSSDQIYAAKIIKKRNVQHALNELRIFQLSHKHPNFVTLYQVFDLPTEAIFVLE